MDNENTVPNESDSPERRQSRRTAVSCMVTYRVNLPLEVQMLVGDKEIDATVLDLSEAGIAVLTNHGIPMGSLVILRFAMLNNPATGIKKQEKAIEVIGEVRYNLINQHNLTTQENIYRLGIRFLGMTRDETSFITNFINSASSQLKKDVD